jgi:hypothetical protein
VLLERQGGTPPMMGQQPRTDSLFYYFRLEDQIPDDHLLKGLDRSSQQRTETNRVSPNQ